MRVSDTYPGRWIYPAALACLAISCVAAEPTAQNECYKIEDLLGFSNAGLLDDESNLWDSPRRPLPDRLHGHFGVVPGGKKLSIKRPCGPQILKDEVCVDLGTRWLATHQQADGHWDSLSLGSRNKIDTALTALALLGFLNAGHSEKVGEHKFVVRSAIAWLKSKQDEHGRIFDTTDSPEPLSELGCPEALATFALTQAASMANEWDTRSAAQRALDYCAEYHQQIVGTERRGFGFTPRSESNLMATAWFLMAMRTGRAAGLQVPQESFDGAVQFVNSLEHTINGHRAFSFSEKDERIESGGLQLLMGKFVQDIQYQKEEDFDPAFSQFLASGIKPASGNEGRITCWYFGTICALKQSGTTLMKWDDALMATLTASQIALGDDAGTWAEPHGMHDGRAVQTALSCMCLELRFRLNFSH